MQTFVVTKKYWRMASVLVQSLLGVWLSVVHPFYVSMTDIQYNMAHHALEISVRIFTDDFEGALRKTVPGKVDLIHPQDKNKMNEAVVNYITQHLQLQPNGKPAALSFVGYEQQEESTWCYFEISGVNSLQQLNIANSLLHDYNANQINMLHVKANGKEQSTKLDYPETAAKFSF